MAGLLDDFSGPLLGYFPLQQDTGSAGFPENIFKNVFEPKSLTDLLFSFFGWDLGGKCCFFLISLLTGSVRVYRAVVTR